MAPQGFGAPREASPKPWPTSTNKRASTVLFLIGIVQEGDIPVPEGTGRLVPKGNPLWPYQSSLPAQPLQQPEHEELSLCRAKAPFAGLRGNLQVERSFTQGKLLWSGSLISGLQNGTHKETIRIQSLVVVLAVFHGKSRQVKAVPVQLLCTEIWVTAIEIGHLAFQPLRFTRRSLPGGRSSLALVHGALM